MSEKPTCKIKMNFGKGKNNHTVQDEEEGITLTKSTGELLKDALMHPPKNCSLSGPLAKVTGPSIYNRIRDDLKKLKSCGNHNLKTLQLYLENVYTLVSPGQRQDDDVKVITHIHANHARIWVMGNTSEALKNVKKLMANLGSFKNITHKNHVMAVFMYQLCWCYIYKKKLGKAWCCLQTGKNLLQNATPNAWTAEIFEREGLFLLIFAQNVQPEWRERLYERAIESYRLAAEHCLCHQDDLDNTGVHKAAFNYVHMVYIMLRLPSPNLIIMLKSRDILLNNANSSCIEASVLHQTHSLLCTAKSRISQSSYKKAYYMNNYILLGEMYWYFRKSQRVIRIDKDLHGGSDNLLEAFRKYRIWNRSYGMVTKNLAVPVIQEQFPALLINLNWENVTREIKMAVKRTETTSEED